MTLGQVRRCCRDCSRRLASCWIRSCKRPLSRTKELMSSVLDASAPQIACVISGSSAKPRLDLAEDVVVSQSDPEDVGRVDDAFGLGGLADVGADLVAERVLGFRGCEEERFRNMPHAQSSASAGWNTVGSYAAPDNTRHSSMKSGSDVIEGVGGDERDAGHEPVKEQRRERRPEVVFQLHPDMVGGAQDVASVPYKSTSAVTRVVANESGSMNVGFKRVSCVLVGMVVSFDHPLYGCFL
jgi:hypothetical protein